MEKSTIQNEHLIIQKYIDMLLKSSGEILNFSTFLNIDTAKKAIYYSVWTLFKEKHDSENIVIEPKNSYLSYRYDLSKLKFTGINPVVTELSIKDWFRKHRWEMNALIALI